jgi:hypothetical protein
LARLTVSLRWPLAPWVVTGICALRVQITVTSIDVWTGAVKGRVPPVSRAWFNPPMGRGLALAVGCVLVAAASCGSDEESGAAVPRFVAAAAAIEHRYEGGFQHFVGGGVAVFDCDDDGRSELYLAGGAAPAGLFRNASPVGGPLQFDRIPSELTDLTGVTGAYPLELDGDGLGDLVVLRVGEDVVLRGLGDCRFERLDDRIGLGDTDSWTVAFSATWEGDNRWPTLAFGDYLAADRTSCLDGRLYRPDAASGRYGEPIALRPGLCPLSMLFSDWSRSGRADLRVSNDRHYFRDGGEQLWRVAPGEEPRPYGEAEGWVPLKIWGMGIASHDVTGDGYPEVFLTSQGDNKLQALVDGPARPAYEDIALERGATAHRPYAGGDVLPSTAWHAEFADVNNDGLADLFVAKGNVEAQEGYATRDPSNLLIGQPDGTFAEGGEEAGIVAYDRARGGAVVDLDLDGLLDLVVVNRMAPVTVWRNLGSAAGTDGATSEPLGAWAAVQLRQPAPNVDAVGAWVEVRAGERVSAQELTVGGGHAGGQRGWIHFGLGAADEAEVRVTWPDGEVGAWMDLPIDGFAIIERGATEVATWAP